MSQIPPAQTPPAPGIPVEDERLTVGRKIVFGTGDWTVNTVLTALSFFYASYFLVQVAGMRAELAGLVQLVARFVDALTDPLMGRISDRTRLQSGRRRPYFLIGAIPFGVSFAFLWWNVPIESQLGKFAYYTAIYCLLSVSMTIVSVPYLSLQPEIALGYDARTSLNAYRNAGSVLGVLTALGFLPLATLVFGGETRGFALGAALYGLMLALPWLAVYRVTWERPEFRNRPVQTSFLEAARLLARHRSYRQLMGFYLCGRVSMDLVAPMLFLFFSYWIVREQDFYWTLVLFLLGVLASLPFWLHISFRSDKVRIFVVGSLWWMCAQLLLLFVHPDWPRWTLFLFAPIAGIGYAVVDLFPWAMLGEVVDEDDLATGERREGLYNGFFTFLRKLAGSLAVAIAMFILAGFGYEKGSEQAPQTITAIRILTALGPAVFLGIGVWIAWGYPLTRERHRQIVRELEARAPEP